MVGQYKANWCKKYKRHAPENIRAAVAEYKKGGVSLKKCGETHGLPKSVLFRHVKNPDTLKQGGQTALSPDTEKYLLQRLIACAEWGYPMDTYDLRIIVKGFLDRRGINHSKFKNNLPGPEWAYSFLKRNKEKLAHRMCQNIKRSRAGISHQTISEYFDNLSESIEYPHLIFSTTMRQTLQMTQARKKSSPGEGVNTQSG